MRNIRLWDPQVLLRSYSQLQELRPYYSFTTVSVDRYAVNGVYTQTMLAPRELRVVGLPPQAQTWVNQHITYTHGYGVAVSAVNQVASGGSPDFLVQDVPPVSSAPSLAVTQPQIYYGLLGTNYVLVDTKYPDLRLPGRQRRRVLATTPAAAASPSARSSTGSPSPSASATSASSPPRRSRASSRVIILNNIRARLAAAAPFLSFDSNPYMVVAGGRLYWIADAYTTTSRIPYSQPNGAINYIRNSVKVVIDAYNGSMRFYVFDPQDPLIRTYEKIFPGVFYPSRRCRRRCASTCATRRTSSRPAGRAVRHLPRHRPGAALQQGQPVGDPAATSPSRVRRRPERLLHDHAAARPDQGRVRAHPALRAQRARQHDRLARRRSRTRPTTAGP